MNPLLQRTDAARDEIPHHVPSSEPLLLQVCDSLNDWGNPAKILGNRIPSRNLLGRLPDEGEAILIGYLPIEPPLLLPRP